MYLRDVIGLRWGPLIVTKCRRKSYYWQGLTGRVIQSLFQGQMGNCGSKWVSQASEFTVLGL